MRAVLAGWLVGTVACSAPQPTPASRPITSRPAAPVEMDDPSVRLRRGLDNRPAMTAAVRNPFRFGTAVNSPAAVSRRAVSPLPPPEGLPLLPLPLAQPPLRLLGLVKLTNGTKVAVISVGSDLILAQSGDLLAGRFRVGRVGEDLVELTDAVGDRHIRLALP